MIAENKMAEIAEIFGRKLGEAFYVVEAGDTLRQRHLCRFTFDGLQVWSDVINNWMWDGENLLHDIVTGQVTYWETGHQKPRGY